MSKRILIIDDEKDLCFFVKKGLEAAGDFEVTVCHDGEEGIKQAKKLYPDLMFIDVMMPGRKDGPDVIVGLKDNEETKDIPYVFLTGIFTGEEAEASKNIIGGSYYVAKPIKIDELVRIINKLAK